MSSTALPALVAIALSSTALGALPLWVVRDLGTHAGPATKLEPGSVGTSIAGGFVVGYAVTDLEHRNFHAFRATAVSANMSLADLGVLAGDDHSIAFGVNAIGDTVGVSYVLGELASHGVLWKHDGTIVPLGLLEPHDVNGAGIIAGSTPVNGALGTSHATRWNAGVATDLGTLGGVSSMAFAISDSGWIVGQSLLSNNASTHAFLVAAGPMIDLGTHGGSGSRAFDIHDLVIVGVADVAGNLPRATRWTVSQSGAVVSKQNLGTLPGAINSAAFGVNSAGTIVGNSGDRAVRWTNGVISDLNGEIASNSGWQLTRATSVDEEGRIAGVGKHLGLQRAFVLEKRDPADLDADGNVGAADLAILLGAWGTANAESDLNGDGAVGADDLAVLLGSWSVA